MYKHKRKSPQDGTGDSTRPSTVNSGRLSQLSDASSKSVASSKTNQSRPESAGKKDGKAQSSADLTASRMPDLASAKVHGAQGKEMDLDIRDDKKNKEAGSKSIASEVIKKEASSHEIIPLSKVEEKTHISTQQTTGGLKSNPTVPPQKTSSQQAIDSKKSVNSQKDNIAHSTPLLPTPQKSPQTSDYLASTASLPSPQSPDTPKSAPPPPPPADSSTPLAPPPEESSSIPTEAVPSMTPASRQPAQKQQSLNESNQADGEEDKRVKKIIAQSVNEYAKGSTGKLGLLELNPNELLNQKRRLKKVDRHSDYNPVTLSRKELFEEEYERNGETPPEHLPLHVLKPTIVQQNISADLCVLNLNGIDQVSSFLFALLIPGNTFLNLNKLLLSGCLNLTDQGMKWIAKLFPHLQQMEINACKKVTEKGLHHVFMGCPDLQNLSVMATDVCLIPDSIMSTKIPKGSITRIGTPIITIGRKFKQLLGNEVEGYFEETKRKIVILREAGVKVPVTPLLTKDDSKSSLLFTYKQWQPDQKPESSKPAMLFNVFEIPALSALQDSLVTDGSIVLIACHPPSNSEDMTSYAHKVVQIMASVIVKCPDVYFLLIEISEKGNPTKPEESLQNRIIYLTGAMQTATYDLYKRNWNLESLDFKGQEGLAFGIGALDALKSLTEEKRFQTLAVKRDNFQETVSAALIKASEDVKELVPWVHCEWSAALREFIDDIPKLPVTTLDYMSKQPDKATQSTLHMRYAYSRVGKVVKLLQNWGEAMFHWHSSNVLCVSDMAAYETLLTQFMSTPAPEKVKICCFMNSMPCWKADSLKTFIKNHKTAVETSDLISLLKRQGLLLSISPQMLEDENTSGQTVYVKMMDLPDEPEILGYLWPEPQPTKRVIQTNKCYNFLPEVPTGFMSKLFRTLLKVFQPICLWKTGFLVRQGPVDVKAMLRRYKGERLDDTPVLVLSARVIHLGMDMPIRPYVDEHTSKKTAMKVMYACFRQVAAVLDYTCLKTKVYPCITLPCPECAEFKTQKMVDIEHNWHLPYYIALASKRRSCATHKNITAYTLCDIQEEQGEGCIIPQHNFCYQLATSKVIKQEQSRFRFREMDPPEKCYYCGRNDEEPCMRCVMCSRCLKQFAKFAKTIQPGHVTSNAFKVQMFKDGQLRDDERIISNTKGCVYFYKRGHSMQMHDAMTPFYWDQISLSALRCGSFYIHLTFGSGKRLEYHSSGVIVDQHGKSHTNEEWKSKDAFLVTIRMESVQLGKRSRVIIQVKEKEIYREEIDGWYMKFDLNSGKFGIFILHAPGLKLAWDFINRGSKHFTEGSTLEVKDGNEVHPAIIKEQKKLGYLVLEMNQKKVSYISTSPNLMPTGTTEVKGESLASELPALADEESTREPVPLRAFYRFQVPTGFEVLLEKGEKDLASFKAKNRPQSNRNNQEAGEAPSKTGKGLLSRLLEKCIFLDFPSVWYGRQNHMRDPVERAFFNEGKFNYSMNSLLLMPQLTTKEDLIVPSQGIFTGDFKLHPLCYCRGDITTVMSSCPTNKQQMQLECFHCLHMLDNEGFPLDLSGSVGGFFLLWAWSLLLLRLQKQENLKEYKSLVKGVAKVDELTPKQVNRGLKQLVKAICQALFLSLGEAFDFRSTLISDNIQPWQDLMMQHSEKQGLLSIKSIFMDDTWLMCETHAGSWQVDKGLDTFHGLPGQYTQFIYSLSISNNGIKELPPGVFAGLSNAKELDLSCNKLDQIPEEIGLCVQLTSLNVFDNYLKTLPDGLSKCTKMFRLFLDKNDMPELPPVVMQLKNLQRLYAQFLHLKSLPDNIGDLTELQNLSLSGNCFKTLPDSLKKMTKLANLSLNGVAWMRSRSNSVLSKDHFEEFLKSNNLHRWLERYDQDRSSIFQFFDEDTNGTLDAKEIGKLNAMMFDLFPRFGYQGNNPDEDTPSGFPTVIFELTSLEYLSLQYQGIVSVPDDIEKLTKLHTLHLGNNPSLLTISAQIGNNPLKRLELEGCPRLKTPPKEIRAKGFHTTFAYLKRLLSGSVTCKRTKLMVVGLGGAGKTSLVKSLLSTDNCAQLTIGEEITDGIDICNWTVPTEEGNIVYSVWDFAGQTIYYNTHQFFLSDRAVYLLLWNIRLGHEHAGLSFWLSSISVHAPNAPIFIVGTHLDQVSKAELPMMDLQRKFPQIYGFHFVSSHTGKGIPELQQHLLEVTLKEKYMGEKIPGVWLKLEKSLKSVAEKKVIHYGEVRSRATKCGIFDHSEIAQAVQFLHDLGSLQHFTSANLKSHVVINPQWIVDVMACVVSVKDSPVQLGRLYHRDLGKVWKDYSRSLYKWMLKLTEEFDLTFPLKDEPVNLVPCLLPEKRPEFTWPQFEKDSHNKHSKIVYKFEYLPAGLFNRGQVRLHQFSDSALIWKRGSYLKKNGHVCLIYQSEDSELTVKAYGPSPENLMLLVHEVFETLILESFKGIAYDFYLPCPDCASMVVKDPHMFSASIIRRATELKAPFLQCLKYFHTISITDLQASMPPDSSTDFDLHLVQAVRGLKELQQDVSAEVFACFCLADMEKKDEETVLPTRVTKDVQDLGYKCWLPEDITKESTDEMAKALLDAKVFLVFMSNNFVEDETCCNLFKYARLTLKKPIIIVAVGSDLNWKQSSLGILMADEVFVNMMKASRYLHKFPELEAMLEDKLCPEKKKAVNFPPCFISYSWQNSAQAVSKGSRSSEGAVGYGDPRDIKDFLEENGIKCWIDVERVGIHGLFEDIGEGLINCRVVVVCISDQYAASDNCAMEFRYAVSSLKLPIVLAVVGTGNKWRASELGIMSLSYPLVSFQEKSSNSMEKLLNLVRNHIPIESEKKKLKAIDEKANKENENNMAKEQQKLSFQELCELAQRKFLKQVSQYTDNLDSMAYPNILLVDLCKQEEEKGQIEQLEKEKPSDKQPQRPETAKKQLFSGSNNYQNQAFCIHLLCEHEGGWHMSGKPIQLSPDFGHSMEPYLPYLARVTTIAKFSKKLILEAQASDTGRAYLKMLEENPTVAASTDFQESYTMLRQLAIDSDTESTMGDLQHCQLPSGKQIWLCDAHSQDQRITIISAESVTSTTQHQHEVLGVDYMLQALEELNMDSLPQQLRDSQRLQKQKKQDEKSNKLENAPDKSNPRGSESKDIPDAQNLKKESSATARETPSKTPLDGRDSSAQVQDRPSSQQQQQRPTLSRAGSKSRACLLM